MISHSATALECLLSRQLSQISSTVTDDTTWSTIATQFCNGTRQSPIDIVSSNLQPDSSLTGFNLTGFNSSALTKITNTGKTGKEMRLAGGGLPGEYVGVQVHLHWGNKASSPGSEHSVDGRRYPMELHIVNTKSIYNGNLSVAANDSEGLAALGFFIEATSETDKPDSWKTLTSYLPKIIEKSNFADISPNITVYDLISAVNISRYYRYLGSLTTPNCNEAVVWTVFKEPIKVSQNLIDLFSTTVHINDSSSQLIINNYRHVQALNSRVVKTQPSSNTGTRCLISLLSLGVMLIHASQTLGSL
uniref:Carbonic anhydrase n=1 Tax=Denticeps clupeoides TaxID=299321 RepID=A0AAY4A282_9TELE